MATKRRKIRRRKQVEEIEEVPEELEDEVIEDDLDDELDEEELEEEEELEDALEEEEPPPKRKRRKRSPREVEEPEEEEFDDEPEDEEPPPKPKAKKPAASKKAATPPAKQDVEIKKVDDQIAESVLSGLLDAMDTGQSIIATRLSSHSWQFSNADAVALPTGPKLKGKEFKDEVLSDEYKEWHEEWADMTYQEKKVYAKKAKATWDEHEDQRVDNIRMSSAVRAKLNIEKYKPEYVDKSARDRLQGK